MVDPLLQFFQSYPHLLRAMIEVVHGGIHVQTENGSSDGCLLVAKRLLEQWPPGCSINDEVDITRTSSQGIVFYYKAKRVTVH